MPPKATITSSIKPTHTRRSPPIEAWQFKGQPVERWPDWVVSWANAGGMTKPLTPKKDYWGIRDEHGYLDQWLAPKVFEERYETIK